ncbi:MAG: ABC transporter permease [Leptospiraceae bacterium]|nr:ABC transporter permease [Leptospiraceae bacterium]MDW7977143.1 ABC transporter permease [Leptospiraceae bacterium]
MMTGSKIFALFQSVIRLIKKVIKIYLIDPFIGAGETLYLIFRVVLSLPHLVFKINVTLHQMYIYGFKSLFVVSVVAVFTGMLLSLQSGLALKDFGQEELVGQLLVVTLTREMAPFMTALILSASVGSAMAAEIGTMKVSEEIDALEVMSIDPVKFLVLPRMVGFTIMIPVLSNYASLLGILGGSLVAKTQLGVEYETFYDLALSVLKSKTGLKDIWVGNFKAFVFGLIISSISCHQGLKAQGGAIGVGRAVRLSVVLSYLFVIMFGYFISAIFYR